MSCDAGADVFIEKHFHDCVYNVRDYIGFCLGLAAIVFWIIAQLPQYYRNYKTKSAEALSPWFLAQWLLGDTFNLIGALLQGQQLPTTVYTAMYFVIADMFMMMQYIYYGALQRRRETVLKLQARRRHHHHHHHRRQQQQQQTRPGGSSSREREALLGPPDSSSALAERGQEQQQQQQSPAWPSQQQHEQQEAERRRVSQQQQQQHKQQGLHDGLGVAGSEWAWQQGTSSSSSTVQLDRLQQQQQQYWQQQASGAAVNNSGCESDTCSDCSSASAHSSSKGVKPLSRNGSPCRPCCDGPAVCPPSCGAAAAAAAASGSTSRGVAPGFRLPGGVVWGGVRPVIAVAVLVTMGLVSLLPASSTRAMVPVSLPHAAAGSTHSLADSSLASRAMHGGAQQHESHQQQQGSSIHLSRPLHDRSSSSSSSSSVGSDSDSSSRTGSSSSNRVDAGAEPDVGAASSRGWLRKKRVAGGFAGADDEHDWSFIVGTGLGYVASVLYLCSRISQIHKNYTRKSSEGLALVMFIMAVCANLCTGTSIILRTFTWVELKEQLPWIIGSLGTISLDMVILWQSTKYSKEAQQQQGGVGGGAAVGSQQDRHHRHHHQHSHQHHSSVEPWGDGADAAAVATHRRVLGRRLAGGAGVDPAEVVPLVPPQPGPAQLV